jgi:hypothetical protein
VQQKLAIHTKIYLHQKGSHTTCLKYIKTPYRFIHMLFTIQNSTRNKQDTQTEKQGLEIYINTYLTTARSTAINSALSAVFKQRNVAKLQATAPPTTGGKKQILSSPQTTTTAADQKTGGEETEEKIGPTVVVSEQETSRPRNHQRNLPPRLSPR